MTEAKDDGGDAQTDLRPGSILSTGRIDKLSAIEFINSDPELSVKLAKGHHESALRAGIPVGMSQEDTTKYIDSVSLRKHASDDYF